MKKLRAYPENSCDTPDLTVKPEMCEFQVLCFDRGGRKCENTKFTILSDPFAVSGDLNRLINEDAAAVPSVHKITSSSHLNSDTMDDACITRAAVRQLWALNQLQ